jgi:glutaredoxin 2
MINLCFVSQQVPSLEHNQVKGESLDLIKYIDSNFEGPLLPQVKKRLRVLIFLNIFCLD